MNKFAAIAGLTLFLMTTGPAAAASPEIGAPAPEFSAMGADGKSHALSDFRGKFVVLEWLNHECPYVKKHYDTQNMQGLQMEMTGKDVVWLSINSSAPGKQGHMTAEEAKAKQESSGAKSTHIILDSDGKVGRLYEAKTTPHMFVVDPAGELIYKGAIDDQASFDKASVEGAKNYVRQCASEAMAAGAVSEPATKPYGCSIKY